MASFVPFVDQENVAPAGRRNAKTVGEQTFCQPLRSNRPVLGEISQNINTRRQPTRNAKQNPAPFTIFSDEDVAPKPFHHAPQPAKLHHHKDKENQVPKVFKPSVFPEPIKPIEDVEDRHMQEEAEDSPMLLDTSVQQWRVPPLDTQHGTVDIDSEPEYSQDIYKYLREAELKHMPKWNYMSKQPDISHNMRAILVDWLVEVAEEYKLQTETLYLAVGYIDRFLSFMSVQRGKLQLVGTAAMFIASKYEEIYPPDVGEFVYITDDTYNKRQVLRMEHLVLKVLGFDLSVPSSHLFVNQLAKFSKTEERTTHLAMYLNELSLLAGHHFLRFPPSLTAAASLALARHTVGNEAWPEELMKSSSYSMDDLQECLLLLHQLHTEVETSPQQAIREKYKQAKYHAVADATPAVISRD